MYFNVYSIPVFISAILMLLLALLIRKQRSAAGVVYFILLMLAGSVYSFFYALEISASELTIVNIFYKLEYLGIPFIPAFFLLFAISYTRKSDADSPYLLIPLLLIPSVTAILAFTSEYHDVFISGRYIDEKAPFPVLVFEKGAWYWVQQVYSISAIIYSIVILFRMLIFSAPAFRKQVSIVLAGSVVPFAMYLAYHMGFFPDGLDPLPFSFAFSGLVIFLGIFRLRLFSLYPLARNMLFENIPDGVLVMDSYLRLVDFNRAASSFFHIKPADIGEPAGITFDNWPEIISYMTNSEPGKNFEVSRITDRQALFLECYFISLTNDYGAEKGKMLIVHDVTDHKKAELERNESEEKFGLIFENAPLGLMYYDRNGIVEICNEYFIRLLGSSEERLTGLSMLKLSDKRIVNAVKKTFQGEKAVFEGKYTSETGNRSVYVRAIFQPVIMKEQSFEGGFCIVEDITGRKVSEEKIKRTNAELKRLNAEKDRFFSILAHDLRSPFSSFLGYTDVLSDSLDSMSQEMIHTIVGSMKESANNLYSLLENLLQWSRMQQGMVDYMPEELLLRDRILNCIEPLLTFANNKVIDVNYNLPGEMVVFADRKMFDTVIRNIFTNAVKFTPKVGSIDISASHCNDEFVEICFSDTGIGMSSEMADNLFRLDVKTSRSGTEGELSTGLGLILCREFIDMHGGTLYVESREGEGSSFFIRLKKSAPQ